MAPMKSKHMKSKPMKSIRKSLGKDKGSKIAPRLLFIGEGVDHFECLIRATRKPVKVIFVKHAWTVGDLMKAVKARVGKGKHQFASVGIFDHGSPGHFQLLKKVSKKGIGLEELHKHKDLVPFFKFLASYVKPPRKLGQWQHDNHSRIDLMGCNVAAGKGMDLINELERITKVNWTASSNIAGNPSVKADWVAETEKHLGSIAPCYFDTQKLKKWTGTLYPWMDRSQFGPQKDGTIRIDIGTFGTHVGAVGVQFLKGQTPTLEDLRSVVQAVQGDQGEQMNSYRLHNQTTLLNDANRQNLKKLADETHVGNRDHKRTMSREELAVAIGDNAFSDLLALFGDDVNQIQLRRVEAHGDCINFHKDVSLKTMQVPLNGADEYEGGRLAYITANGLEIPERPAGCATIHDNTIVHGVTQMKSGVRYSLFLQKVRT